MNRFSISPRVLCALSLPLWLAGLSAVHPCRAGVTFITHGLNGNTDGWITGMAGQIPNYPEFLGTNFTCYKAYFYDSGGSYFLTADRVSGGPPQDPASGEIIVKFDWSQLADGNSYDTYQIASAAVPALLSTNFIPELGGHALAEFPLHLVGHSRGGSLICEISRRLGTNGVWVDHLTTLDPHPLNDPEFPLDGILYSNVDAPAQTYASVLFHGNYWQDANFLVQGLEVAGAYVRKLTSFSGGYSSQHSDVHLWYHGTIDFRVPASDLEASIASAQRTSWWNAYETQGTNAGFRYSLIGGGNRLSTDQPLGGGTPAIRDGYNQLWDFGAGQSANRTALATINGAWPSLIKFNRLQTNVVAPGQGTLMRLFYQWAVPTNSSAAVSFFLDDDFNVLNTNQTLLGQIAFPGTGAPANAGAVTLEIPFTNTASPGWHSLLAVIDAAGQRRYLYAPELVLVAGPPVLDIAQTGPSEFQIGVNGTAGQRIILQDSADLITWQSLVTNTLAASRWVYTDTPPAGSVTRFLRVFLPQP